MSPTRAIVTCFRKYATFRGRASLSEFMWFQMLVLIVLIAFFLRAEFGHPAVTLSLLAVLAVLFMPWLAVSVRRLHDIDWTGWWMLTVFFPPAFWAVMAIMVRPGTRGSNRFGPQPGGGAR